MARLGRGTRKQTVFTQGAYPLGGLISAGLGISGEGIVDATGVVTVVGSLAIAGEGTIAATGVVTAMGTLDIAGVGTITFDGFTSPVSSGLAISGTGTITITGGAVVAIAASVQGQGAFAVNLVVSAATIVQAVVGREQVLMGGPIPPTPSSW
jgi:hypothetical protein